MRRLVLLIALLIPLAAATAAASKEPQSVTACGAGECTTLKDGALLGGMTDVGPPTSAPRRPAPSYRVRVAVGDGGKVFGQFKSWWVPSAGRLQPDDGTWIAVRPKVRRALDRLTRGLETFPGRRLPGFENAGAEGVTPPPARADTPAPARSASSSSGDVPVLPLAAALIVSDWPRSWPRRGCQDEGRSPAALSLYGAAGSRRLPGRTI